MKNRTSCRLSGRNIRVVSCKGEEEELQRRLDFAKFEDGWGLACSVVAPKVSGLHTTPTAIVEPAVPLRG